MKYVFVAFNCYPFPLALHLKAEGQDVTIAFATEKSQIRQKKEDESPEEIKQRLSVYDGMIDKISIDDLFKILSNVPQDKKQEYFFFFDYSDMYVIAEKILNMGFSNGLFPTELYFRMEKERELSKEFVKKFYKKVKVAESHNFEKVLDGIKHINDSEDVFVLKSNGNVGKTVVPATDILEIAKKQLTDTLEKYRKDYEKGGYLLEKKIPKCLEVTPIIVFYNGVPVYSVIELECKEFGAGNIGIQKGGNLALSVRTDIDCEMNKIAFPPIIHKMAKEHPGMSIYDAGLLYDGNDFWFTEFCAMRFGWDGIFSEIVMADMGQPFVANYFEDIVQCKNPLKNKYGVSIRLFNLEGNTEQTFASKDDLPILFYKSIENNFFMYMIKYHEEDGIVSVGGSDLIGTITGADDDLETAVSKTYNRIGKVHFEKLYYRPKFDFLSTDYHSSIINRLKAMEKFI